MNADTFIYCATANTLQGSQHSYISYFSYKFYRNPIELLQLEKYSYISYILGKRLLYFLYFAIKFGTLWATHTQSLTDLTRKSSVNL